MVQLESWSRRIAGLRRSPGQWLRARRARPSWPVRTCHWIPDIQPRQLRETMGLLGVARRIVQSERVDVVVSTGASVAIPFFVAARMYGAEGHYIESAARVEGPVDHRTGRGGHAQGPLLHAVGAWADSRWKFAGSVFDGYAGASVERAEATDAGRRRPSAACTTR